MDKIVSKITNKVAVRFSGSKLDYSQTVAIDTNNSTIHSFSMVGNDANSIEHKVKSYAGPAFDQSFFAAFKQAMAEFAADAPSEGVRKISLILPDSAAAVDIINVPTMKGGGSKNALQLSLGGIYRNYSDLKVRTHLAMQNKQYSTFNTVAIQKNILNSLYSICSENKLLVNTATIASASSVSALLTLNPKLKGASFLFLDVKDKYSRFVFVVQGRVVGFYPLPFGLEFLMRPRVVGEDMLFNHIMADLTVLNAREKAKARKLSVLAEEPAETVDITDISDLDDEEENESLAAEASAPTVTEPAVESEEEAEDSEEEEKEKEEPFAMSSGQKIATPKYMAKKTPRKLPKFMQRPIPETDEGKICENFRVFMKWALTLIHNNEKITQLAPISTVYVNLPEEISYVIDYANEEREENKVEFAKISQDKISSETLRANLELFGGFFPKNIHSLLKF